MNKEEQRVHQIMRDIAQGNRAGNKLVFDPVTKTLRPAKPTGDPDRELIITPEDMIVSQ